jgi:phage replication-related protein YjqB (UPF0714/DUF867 family)
MADRYRSFADLAANERLGIDYRIRIEDRGTSLVILAPHGGWIEPGTSEVAEAIAGSDLSFYAFEALKEGGHSDFHITSHRFDEPKAVALVGRSRTAVAIHGRRNEGRDSVWLGGRAKAIRNAIGASLRDAGFEAELNERLPGLDRANICNRTLSGEGVQLEVPRSLRRRMACAADLLDVFCQAVRNAVGSSPVTK